MLPPAPLLVEAPLIMGPGSAIVPPSTRQSLLFADPRDRVQMQAQHFNLPQQAAAGTSGHEAQLPLASVLGPAPPLPQPQPQPQALPSSSSGSGSGSSPNVDMMEGMAAALANLSQPGG
jgi:hypothetical protein